MAVGPLLGSPVVDDFNRADGPLGGNWVRGVSNTYNNPLISSNQVAGVSFPSAFNTGWKYAFPAEVFVYVPVDPISLNLMLIQPNSQGAVNGYSLQILGDKSLSITRWAAGSSTTKAGYTPITNTYPMWWALTWEAGGVLESWDSQDGTTWNLGRTYTDPSPWPEPFWSAFISNNSPTLDNWGFSGTPVVDVPRIWTPPLGLIHPKFTHPRALARRKFMVYFDLNMTPPSTTSVSDTDSNSGSTEVGSPTQWFQFGRDTQGPVSDSGYQGYKSASPFSFSGGKMLLDHISAFVDIGSAPITSRAMIYADSAGSPGALIATSSDVVIPIGSSQRVLYPISGTLPAGTYWISVGFDSAGGGSVSVWCETAGTGTHKYVFDSTASDPFGSASTASSAGDMDVAAFGSFVPVDVNSTTTESASISVPISVSDADGTITEIPNMAQTIADSGGGGADAASVVDKTTISDANGATTEVPLIRISIQDSDGATTEVPVLSVQTTVTDSDSSTTETPSIRVGIVDSNGAVTETPVETAQIPSSDSGSGGVDSTALSTVSTVSDADGTISESTLIRIAVSDSDSTITESPSEIAQISITEGNGATTEIPSIGETTVDAGAGSEVPALSAQIPAVDSDGTTTETPLIRIGAADTNSVVEAASEVAQLLASDTNSAITESTLVGILAAEADSGAASESLVLKAAVPVSDADGTIVENASVSSLGNFTDSDNGTGTENSGETARIPGSDGNGSSEIPTLIVHTSAADVNGSDTETASLAAHLAGADLGTATIEIAAIIAKITAADAGSDSETASYRAVYVVADIGSGSDAFGSIVIRASDLGLGDDEYVLAVALEDQDTGTGADVGSMHTDTLNSYPMIRTGTIPYTGKVGTRRSTPGRVL